MGYPVVIGASTAAKALALSNAYAACLRRNGRTVRSWPAQELKSGVFQVILDVCGQYDPALAAKCQSDTNSKGVYVDLRKFSPGKVVKIKGARR